ncbi:hypothetical protein L7F22_025557 [Adiantum nelumboides]|nr:hypothetical protein [Adiantum nelumboides]
MMLARGDLPNTSMQRFAEAETLYHAVQVEATIDSLIARGLDLNKPFPGSRQPALHMSVRDLRFQKPAFELLIRKGADIQQMDDYGVTPLHWALIEGHRAAEWLIELGADVHAKVGSEVVSGHGGGGQTSQTSHNMQGAAAATDTSRSGVDAAVAAKYAGATPLHIVGRKRLPLAQLLFSRGAASDILSKDSSGDTALHAAVQGNSPDVLLCFLQTALDNAPPSDTHKVVDVLNDKLQTPLHYAASRGAVYIAPLLLQSGADPLARDASGATPLHYAALRKDVRDVELLLPALLKWARQRHPQHPHAPINLCDNEGKTALHWAADAGSPEVFIHLTAGGYGADLDAVDNKQRTPLYFALFRNLQAQNCDLAVAEQLIKLKAKDQNINEEILKCMKLHFSVGSANGQWIEEYYGHLHFPSQDAALIVEELPPIYLALRIGRQDIAEFIQQHSQGIPETAINKGGPKTGRNALQKELLERGEVQRYLEGMYRDRQVYVDAANAVLVGAALIAGITFAGWLQPPLGYTEYFDLPPPLPDQVFQSYAAVQQNVGVRIFWFFNSLSFSFAVAAVIAALVGLIPSQKVFIATAVLLLRKTLLIAVVLLAFSILFVLISFATAGFSVLPPIFKYQANMMSTVIVGAIPCFLLLGWLGSRLWAAQNRIRHHIAPQYILPSLPTLTNQPKANYFVLDTD